MSLIDNILEGHEPVVQMIMMEEGPMAADLFVRSYNNACCQFAGFEDFFYQAQADATLVTGFFAPNTNLSREEH